MTDCSLSECLHLVSRKTAILLGFDSYFTGVPCSRGHISLRGTKRRVCLSCEQQYREERKEDIAEYKRQYYMKNKEKLCSATRKWYSENKERASEYNRMHYLRNKDRYAEWRRNWISENPERKRIREQQWRKENRSILLGKTKEWKRRNHDKVIAYNRNRRSLEKGASGKHSAKDIESIYILQRGKCAHCCKRVGLKFHVDHIVPLAKGGSNWPHNLQILCPPCNLGKQSKDPIDWKQQHGLLL